jgi:hypothetical protein
MSELEVRAYNVGFGDAVLVSIPDRGADGTETARHILIDVGNLLAGPGNQDEVFNDVVDDIHTITGGTVDLYVMTHEHMDHVQGLLAAANAGHPLSASYAWLTGSADLHYYEHHEDARKKLSLDRARARGLVAFHAADADPWLAMMIRNNAALLPEGALGLSTTNYVDHLRGVADAAHTFYIDKDTDLTDKHPFAEATLRVLAPHEDTAEYYGRTRTTATLVEPADSDDAAADPAEDPTPIAPPVGVDAGAFFDLVEARRHLNRRTIMEIDAAANNTSIVLEVEWRGWRLLFPGDAEVKSWRMMKADGLLRPVHFVKVAHHGSVNGTDPAVLDVLMPDPAPDDRPRSAVVSTHDDDWASVPDSPTLKLYRKRCRLQDTRRVRRGTPVLLTFPD